MRGKSRSRRHRAIRSCLLLAALLLGVHFLGLYYYTPAIAQRVHERTFALPAAQELTARWLWAPESGSLCRRYALSANGGELRLSRQEFHPLAGWKVRQSTRIRWERDKSTFLAVDQEGDRERTTAWLFGGATDPDITGVELRVYCRAWYADAATEAEYDFDVPMDCRVAEEDMISWQGGRAFLVAVEDIPPGCAIREVRQVTEEGEKLLCYG